MVIFLKELGFVFLNANIRVFIKRHIYIAIYINNLLITVFFIKKVNKVKFILYNKFNIIDFRSYLYYLGIIIRKD